MRVRMSASSMTYTRRALLARQLHHIDAAHIQVVVLHLGGQGKHRAQLHGGAVVRLFAQVGCGKRHAIPFVRLGFA